MAEVDPVVLVFEDVQGADSGLLDFIDYMLEWSADYPIFVLTLARPELIVRRPGWNVLALDPLAPTAVAAMLDGLAPGLPDDLVAEITRRADGIPLYVVETIRMLQDRGLLVQEGDRYVVTGDVSDLDVPESLHALVASRLDGLSAGERSLLQDASVLGHSFTAAGAAALSGRPEAEIVPVLEGLVSKQVLARDDDPRSPERGQYVFLQTLLQTVAYSTLSRHVRKSRHVAAARHLEQTWPGEAYDIAEVLASHYLEAIRADPDANDVHALRAAARERLADAGRAAASLALGPEAQRYFEHAAELADDDNDRAEMFEQAGLALRQSGDPAAAEEQLRRAIELYGGYDASAGVTARLALANMLRIMGRVDEALALLEDMLADGATDGDRVLNAQAVISLAHTLSITDRMVEAGPLFDQSLTVLEREQASPQLAEALVGRGGYLLQQGRYQEGVAVLRHALALSLEYDLPSVALRAHFNLAGVALGGDHLEEAVSEVDKGLAIARERGDRTWETALMSQASMPLATLGRWDDCVATAQHLLGRVVDIDAGMAAASLIRVAEARDDEALVESCRAVVRARGETLHIDERLAGTIVRASDALADGRVDEALELVRSALDMPTTGPEFLESVYDVGVEAALNPGHDSDLDALIDRVDNLDRAQATPLFKAGQARLRAEKAHRAGEDAAAQAHEQEAIDILRSLGAKPGLAQALLDRHRRRGDEEAL